MQTHEAMPTKPRSLIEGVRDMSLDLELCSTVCLCKLVKPSLDRAEALLSLRLTQYEPV